MTDLSTLVDSLKRELAVPGVFDDAFPDTTQADLLGSLADGFAEAQLEGFFTDMTLDGTYHTSRDLSAAGGALVVIVSALRIIRAQLRGLTMSERYKAGSVEMETQRSATLLKEEMTYLRERLKTLVGTARRSGRSVHIVDAYTSRGLAYGALGGFHHYEYKA